MRRMEQRKSGADATGRVIVEREDEEEKPLPLGAFTHVPIPKEKPDFRMAQKIPVPKEKPIFDATGRVIMEEEESVNSLGSVIAPPLYKKDVFAGKRADEWNGWVKRIEEDKELSSAEKKAFQEIYAFEGGMEKPKGANNTAFAGIIQGTLDGLKDYGVVDGVTARRGQKVKSTELNQEDIHDVYKGYFSDVFKGAAETAGFTKNEGYKILGTIGDDEVAAAFADVLFRDDYMKTSRLAQKSLNAALPESEKISEEGGAGSDTFKALRKVAKDKKMKRIFLDKLGDLRDEAFTEGGDHDRNEYFRFKK